MAKIQYRWNFYPKGNEEPNYRGMLLQVVILALMVYIVLVIVSFGLFRM